MQDLRVGLFAFVLMLSGCGGGGDNSSPQPPVAPTAIQSVVDNTGVKLSWPVVSGADSYHIYYSTDPKLNIKNYAVYANSSWIKNVTSPYVINGLTVAPIYYFIVTAVGKGLESQPSQLVSAVTRYEIVGENGDIVKDKVTNLEWQRCSLGMTWNKSTSSCDGTAKKYLVNQTIPLYSPDKDGWRVPKNDELTSLLFFDMNEVDYFSDSTRPSINLANAAAAKVPFVVADIFPQTQIDRKYQVSAAYYGGTEPVYCSIGFGGVGTGCVGIPTGGSQPLPNYIRLVRDIAKP